MAKKNRKSFDEYLEEQNIELDDIKTDNLSTIEELDEPAINRLSNEDKETSKLRDKREDDYVDQSYTKTISFVEFAILNAFFHKCFREKNKNIGVDAYGVVDSIGRLSFGGSYEITGSYWFKVKLETDNNEFILQTKSLISPRGDFENQFHITAKDGMYEYQFENFYKKIKSLAFNNSEFKGKCIKVKLREGRFDGIEIIDLKTKTNELILNETQSKFIDHFISRISRGGYARYLLNGNPGTGKTEVIREIARKLMPHVTFVIPDFSSSEDLTSIMEACEIFDNGVIIMDDIDLFLGSRENGSYTRLLGQFLSFFDGVKKRKISLLASTNDKGLVDKASQRPGRFNFILDFTYLNSEQIEKVCEIHLDEKWRVKEVYDVLRGKIDGKKVNITGAFISNLGENIREMSEDNEEWSLKDTISLTQECYKGFYLSQVEQEIQTMGFKANR